MGTRVQNTICWDEAVKEAKRINSLLADGYIGYDAVDQELVTSPLIIDSQKGIYQQVSKNSRLTWYLWEEGEEFTVEQVQQRFRHIKWYKPVTSVDDSRVLY